MAVDWCLFHNKEGLCLSAEAWAAWAQALGAVAAIASGFVVANWQARLARRAASTDAAERRMQSTLTLVVLCESACRRIEAFRDNMQSREKFFDAQARAASMGVIEELKGFVRSADGMPLFEVSHETARMAIAFKVHTTNFVEDALYVLEHSRKMDGEAFSGFFKAVSDRATLLRKVLGELENLAERLHEDAGGPAVFANGINIAAESKS